MADIFSKSKRSLIMSSIRAQETKPEIAVRKYLFKNGFRYRKNYKKLPGNPDIVLPKYHSVIFVHGCFWHGHNCKYAKLPQTRTAFWKAKIASNSLRDKKNIRDLRKDNWKVLVIWQCNIRNKVLFAEKMERIISKLKQKTNSV